MKPSKAYILTIDTPLSIEYAKVCSDSCDRVGLKWEYFKGFSNKSIVDAWGHSGVYVPMINAMYGQYLQPNNVQCCTAGHAAIWKKIAEGNEAAIILEHDAVMLQPVNIDVPDDIIAVLGYKLKDISRYDHVKAGKPRQLLSIDGHEGAHAYVMTPKTAQRLIDEIGQRGILGNVDNAYFIRGQRTTSVPLAIVDPTPAIGWLRESTLWSESADRNYEFIPSFQQNYK